MMLQICVQIWVVNGQVLSPLSSSDNLELEEDLTALGSWSDQCKLSFNPLGV